MTRTTGRVYSLSHAKAGSRKGAALIVSLLMLVAVLMIGMSAAKIALQNEKASRNDRDRQIAFQAAEAALIDAELDIENAADHGVSRSALFSKDSALGFPSEEEALCHAGGDNQFLGLCHSGTKNAVPTWLAVDFNDVNVVTMHTVPYGRFTGQRFQVGIGALPRRAPRYIIELMNYHRHGDTVEAPSYFYRITAIGYGVRATTQVVLQSFYRKES